MSPSATPQAYATSGPAAFGAGHLWRTTSATDARWPSRASVARRGVTACEQRTASPLTLPLVAQRRDARLAIALDLCEVSLGHDESPI